MVGKPAGAWTAEARRLCLLPSVHGGWAIHCTSRAVMSAHLAAAAQCFPPALVGAQVLAPNATLTELRGSLPHQ